MGGMRTWTLLITLFVTALCCAQNPEGVYVGELITLRNALIINTKGAKLGGQVYLSEFEKFDFLGTQSRDSLKGVILVPGGSEIVLLGKLFKDSLVAGIISDGRTKPVTLSKISSSPKYNVRRYFGTEAPLRDPLLVGKWNLVRLILPDGKEVDDRYFYEYLSDGEMRPDVESLKRKMEENFRRAALQTGSSNKFTFDPRWIPKKSWQTRGQKLITTSVSDLVGQTTHEYTYQVMNDTLTITNFKGGREIFVRAKD